jgi:hypothetical protein
MHFFLISYWLNVLVLPVSDSGGYNYKCTGNMNGKRSTFHFPKASGEIRQYWYWYDDKAALGVFLFLELHQQLLVTDKWKSE